MIYFDNNATTPLAPELHELHHELFHRFGNPSSLHRQGREAKRLIEEAREIFAQNLGISEANLIFTSGATESLNSVLLSTFLPNPVESHLLVSSVEHSAILETANFLKSLGVQVDLIPVDALGRIEPESIEQLIRPNTRMIAVMFANNEIGNIYPVERIAEIAQKKGILFLCDTVQALGRISVDLNSLKMDFAVGSAHKFHGPKGVGLLYVKPHITWPVLLHGGRQEKGKRAGTENVLGIFLAAKAFELSQKYINENTNKLNNLKNLFKQLIQEKIPSIAFHGDDESQLSNTLNFRIPGLTGESLAMNLDLAGISVSVGSACDSGAIEPSHVLQALGLNREDAAAGLRFSFSRYNKPEEIEQAVLALEKFYLCRQS